MSERDVGGNINNIVFVETLVQPVIFAHISSRLYFQCKARLLMQKNWIYKAHKRQRHTSMEFSNRVDH